MNQSRELEIGEECLVQVITVKKNLLAPLALKLHLMGSPNGSPWVWSKGEVFQQIH